MYVEQLHTELQTLPQLGPVELVGPSIAGVHISDVVHDSRRASPNTLFCAVPGLTVDGHDFVDQATSNGAKVALVERAVDQPIAQMKVASTRQTMAFAAAAVHRHPSSDLAVFGITGTNGKTTTTQLFATIVRSAGRSCEVIGTLDGVHTTPESTELQRQLRDLADTGTDVVALEVSSHALDQHRVDATRFAVAAFSNLTPDHLDYHRDMEDYFEAKKRLFDGRAEIELINVDDPWGARLAEQRPHALTVSLSSVTITSESISGTDIRWRSHSVHVPLPGLMNVANALMAAEAARHIGIDEAEIVSGLANAAQVPGRMETVPSSPEHPTVVVDYSHTPDSIERALETIRSVSPESAITIVFGCGGDRDRMKRPLMGKAAESGADRVVLTNDNPRSENPLLIIADALAGMSEPDDVLVEPDRKVAIERAIIDAGPGDVVLIAGKGHEKTQTIGSDILPFDDVQVAKDVLGVANT